MKIHCVQVFKPTFHETTIIFLKFSVKQNHRDFSYERY